MASEKVPILRVENIVKTYHRGRETITALDGISLDVFKGELLAIVGPSGSGKTTLSHVIGGLITPTSGSVKFRDLPATKPSDKQLSQYRNKNIGFVFQNFSLIPYYTALENVAMPLVVAKVSKQERHRKAETLLREIGLQHRVHQRADKLSGGERQRIAIARALVNNPQIIIADEPTGSLDSVRGNEIMKILETLSHKHGVTILMVTHDLALAERADRRITIRDGKIVEESK